MTSKTAAAPIGMCEGKTQDLVQGVTQLIISGVFCFGEPPSRPHPRRALRADLLCVIENSYFTHPPNRDPI